MIIYRGPRFMATGRQFVLICTPRRVSFFQQPLMILLSAAGKLASSWQASGELLANWPSFWRAAGELLVCGTQGVQAGGCHRLAQTGCQWVVCSLQTGGKYAQMCRASVASCTMFAQPASQPAAVERQ